jgi:hypothetical protein
VDFDPPMLSEGPGTGAEADGWIYDMACRVRSSHRRAAGLYLDLAGRGVPESRVEVDGGAILEAANAAVTF